MTEFSTRRGRPETDLADFSAGPVQVVVPEKKTEDPAPDPQVHTAPEGETDLHDDASGDHELAAPATSDDESGLSDGAEDLAPIDLDEDTDSYGLGPARAGFAGWMNRLFKTSLGPGSAELLERKAVAQQSGFEALIRQAAWTRSVGVLVANKKGTAGKTPVAICLAGVLAAVRGGGVAVVEAADDRGQLAYRAEGEPALGIGELVADLGKVRSRSQLSGYAVVQTSFASVFGSTQRWRAALSRKNVSDVAAVIDEHFTISVWDTGNQYSSGPFSAAVELADVLVVPTMNAYDSVSEALELLDFLSAQGGDPARLAASAIVVFSSDGRIERKPERFKKLFLAKGVPEKNLYDIPFDAHIAERGPITLGKLTAPTREAFTAVAAGVVGQINQNIYRKGA